VKTVAVKGHDVTGADVKGRGVPVAGVTVVDFVLPAGLEATEPPPVRDGVRLLVATADRIRHARFRQFGEFLAEGDLVVVNASATLAAAVDGDRAGVPVEVHFSAELDDGAWVVEVRPAGVSSGPVTGLRPGEAIGLAGDVALVLDVPRPAGQDRLWRAELRARQPGGTQPGGARPSAGPSRIEGGAAEFLARHGRPIRYAYVPRRWPLAEYQTVFGREPGSAEMPSAGRPFTAEIVTDLVTRGVALAPIVLHTGVSSQEPGEPPQPERFRVPESTARLVNATRAAGGRVVAVGTTVTRALESAAAPDGTVRARNGWTDLVLGPERPARVVNGLVSGWHAPGASHLALLTAVAGPALVRRAYAEALRAGYRWHEFGDSCLLLP
jgi:S-adenosylmethionine:tRNA ribosyltransferase-isomerase